MDLEFRKFSTQNQMGMMGNTMELLDQKLLIPQPSEPAYQDIGLTQPPLFHNAYANRASTSNSHICFPEIVPNNTGYINKLSFQNNPSSSDKKNSIEAMREMIFGIAMLQPVHIDPESVKPPKRKNVKISKDPQSVAARHRRERISERIRILQRLVPGGTKMDTASMLDEAVHYLKFLKRQVEALEKANVKPIGNVGFGFGNGVMATGAVNNNYSGFVAGGHQMVGSVQMQMLS